MPQAPPTQQQYSGDGQANAPYSNTLKTHLQLKYCCTHGYDVDHDGWECQAPKPGHIPYLKRDEAHLCPIASMKAQHKTLPDGTGAGKGWIMAQQANKSFYTMAQMGQQPWANVYNQAPSQQQGRSNRKGRQGGRHQHQYGQQQQQQWGQQQQQWGGYRN